MSMKLDRRNFLKGTLATGVVAAGGAALVGCSPSSDTSDSGSSGSTDSNASAVTGSTEGNQVTHTWEMTPDPITDIAETLDYDIVIVGAGLAGVSAAEAAARNGASTAVIERMDEISIRGVDVGNIGSQFHLDEGFDIDWHVPARQLHFDSRQKTNYDLISVWASRSGEVFDYLAALGEPQGISMVHALSGTAKYDGWDELDSQWRVYPDAVSFVRGGETYDTRDDGKQVNWTLGEMLRDSAIENGAEFVYNTHAEQLVGDAESGITGVIVTAEDGSYVQYNAAKAVILATGDISGNQEMIDAFCPIANRADSRTYTPAGANTGDGILMGCWAGAGLSKSTAAPMIHQFTADSVSFNLTSFIMCWLAVNQDGKRYGAEMPFEPMLTNARMNTPGNIAWSIFDSDWETYLQQQQPSRFERFMDGLEETMNEWIEAGNLIQADSLEELAEAIGVPAETFTATVERYNSMAAAGEDTDFDVPENFLAPVQTAPFYAVRNVCSLLTIPFGLHVNAESQVLTEDDQVIDGLYAIGNVQGDFFGDDYPVHFPGVSHGRCVTFGQLVGEAIAKDTVISELEFE